MGVLEKEAVKRVRSALVEAGLDDRVLELEETARTAENAAMALGVELGAIVKSLVFTVGGRVVLALVAGDHRCKEDALPRALDLEGDVARATAQEVKAFTGFSIGGVAPVGLLHPLPTVIDRSLKRFDTVYAAAGHPTCIYPTTVKELGRMTGGNVSWNIAEPMDEEAAHMMLPRSKSMSG